MTNEEMKYKDAIEWLDCFIQGCADIRLNGALRVGKNSIEKQIPKKPFMDNDNGVYRTECCPTCHRSLFPYDHHCRCGQAIDWSDTE